MPTRRPQSEASYAMAVRDSSNITLMKTKVFLILTQITALDDFFRYPSYTEIVVFRDFFNVINSISIPQSVPKTLFIPNHTGRWTGFN